MASEENTSSKGERPTTLRRGSMSRGSYIKDHQQYRPSQTGDHGIDSILEGLWDTKINSSPSNSNFKPFGGIPPPNTESRIKDSGIVHTISHRHCQPGAGDASKLVATIFYKSSQPRHPPSAHPDRSGSPNAVSGVLPPHPPPAADYAPTTNMEDYPLEPPAPEPEPLDHLYGAYISQICLTSFLQLLDDLQKPYDRGITSSHRCLDSKVHPRVMEITFSPPPNPEYITFDELRRHEAIWRFEREWNVEVILQQENVWRKHKRLVVFDMDSTLIQQEVIDEMAKFLGVEKAVSAITERAMNGELDFAESLRARVKLLEGLPSTVFDSLKGQITCTPGARELCKALKSLNFKLAVLSGGFQPLAEWLAADLGLDYAHANLLSTSTDGKTLSGEVQGQIVDAKRKADLLQQIASKEKIPLHQVIAVGDGANDLPMMKVAGLGIAFNAKPIVQLNAPTRINTESLLDVLYLLGFTHEEIDALVANQA